MNFEPDRIIHLIAGIREKSNRFIQTELKNNNIEGLKPIHGDMLFALFMHRQLSMKQISEIVDRKKSTVTTLVEKLITLGYAEKSIDDMDNRISIISLTEKGRGLKDILIDVSNRLMEKVYKDMPAEERKQLVKSLKTINDHW